MAQVSAAISVGVIDREKELQKLRNALESIKELASVEVHWRGVTISPFNLPFDEMSVSMVEYRRLERSRKAIGQIAMATLDDAIPTEPVEQGT